jgi:hypothetical protein
MMSRKSARCENLIYSRQLECDTHLESSLSIPLRMRATQLPGFRILGKLDDASLRLVAMLEIGACSQ